MEELTFQNENQK
jgi:hypothetical protein